MTGRPVCARSAGLQRADKLQCCINNIAKDFLSVKVPFRSFGTLDDALNWVREKLRDVGA
jgi:hypothetical protein